MTVDRVTDPRIALSVCIPTHNFGPFIGETLRSIVLQMTPKVEVVVLDSASTDDTSRIVAGFQEKHERVRYVYGDRKNGIDRDLAHVASLARGEYCWLFSADDIMREGAIATVLHEIESSRPDLLLCMHSNNSLSMQEIDACHPVLRLDRNTDFFLHDIEQQRRYFSLAQTTEAFFSFMSSLIVRRASWESVPLRDEFVGTCWSHVGRLFELMRTRLHVRFLAQALLARRADNDSFAQHGRVRRFSIAIEGLQNIVEAFWGTDSFQSHEMRRVLRNEFGALVRRRRRRWRDQVSDLSKCASAPL
jgi:abequosyltransferase